MKINIEFEYKEEDRVAAAEQIESIAAIIECDDLVKGGTIFDPTDDNKICGRWGIVL